MARAAVFITPCAERFVSPYAYVHLTTVILAHAGIQNLEPYPYGTGGGIHYRVC